MPSISPLYNVKLQSSLDLNTQSLARTNSAKRFILKNLGAGNRIIDASDISRLLKFNGARTITLNNNIVGVVAGDTFTATTDTIFYFDGSATRLNSFVDSTSDAIYQFIYVGNNTWIIINAN
jgi:ribulose kinase